MDKRVSYVADMAQRTMFHILAISVSWIERSRMQHHVFDAKESHIEDDEYLDTVPSEANNEGGSLNCRNHFTD